MDGELSGGQNSTQTPWAASPTCLPSLAPSSVSAGTLRTSSCSRRIIGPSPVRTRTRTHKRTGQKGSYRAALAAGKLSTLRGVACIFLLIAGSTKDPHANMRRFVRFMQANYPAMYQRNQARSIQPSRARCPSSQPHAPHPRHGFSQKRRKQPAASHRVHTDSLAFACPPALIRTLCPLSVRERTSSSGRYRTRAPVRCRTTCGG